MLIFINETLQSSQRSLENLKSWCQSLFRVPSSHQCLWETYSDVEFEFLVCPFKNSGGGLTSCTATIHQGATETFQQVKLKWQSSYVYTSQRCRTAWGCAAARRLKSVRPVGQKQTTGSSVEIRKWQQTRLLLWCKNSSGVAVNWQPMSLLSGVAPNTKTHADVPDTSESYLGKRRGDLLFQRPQKNIPTVDPAAVRETQTGSGKYAQVSLFPVNNQP